jgi:hypothetical protein
MYQGHNHGNMHNTKYLVILLLIPLVIVTGCGRDRGRLANPGFENRRIKTTLFFAGQARDGSYRYNCQLGQNTDLYTVVPLDARHLQWSESDANKDFALDGMVQADINVVTMSSWGESFLPCDVGWAAYAPMQTSPTAQDELFAAAVRKQLLIMPLIESRADWAFRDEFPYWVDGSLAPGTVSQIKELINRYLKNDAHPEWKEWWASVYDRNGESRYAIVIIQAASNRLDPNDHSGFALGFDLIAKEIEDSTGGIKVGFFIDALPPDTHAPGQFKPNPEITGPFLHDADSILGIQCFVPEVWVGSENLEYLINWKKDFSQRWSQTDIPLIMDISPGYDNRLVFPRTPLVFGFNDLWKNALTTLVSDLGGNGMVFNSWNGYTEGMAAVPMQRVFDDPSCCNAVFYEWLKSL